MMTVILCMVILMVTVSMAFAGATEDLLSAAKSKYTTPQMIRTLIKSGANVNAKDNDGKTVLDYAQTDEIKRLILNSAQ